MKTYINCSQCGKETVNEGYSMCCVCVRTYKKRTRPSFFLGVAYSRIKARATVKQKRKYVSYGLKYCTKKEFFDKFLNNKTFLKLFKIWQENDYQQKLAPSFDRIDPTKGYEINNIQVMSNLNNTIKGKSKEVIIYDTFKNKSHRFSSRTNAANFLNCSPSNIYLADKNKRLIFKRYEVRNV